MRLLLTALAATCLPIACAAQTALAPIAPQAWVTDLDYPAAAIRAEAEGVVRFELAIDEKGVTTGCSILESSGSAALDEKTCELLRERARFSPAKDAQGKPIPATYRSAVRWQLPEEAPDMPVSMQLSARFHMSEAGVIENCVASISTPDGDMKDPRICDDLNISQLPGARDLLPAQFVVSMIVAPVDDAPLVMAEEIAGHRKVVRYLLTQSVAEGEFLMACETIDAFPDEFDPCSDFVPEDGDPQSAMTEIITFFGVWAKPDND